MNAEIKNAISGLREVREKHPSLNDSAVDAINAAIVALSNVEQKAKRVVQFCQSGHGQIAEEFAYELSGE